MGFLSSTGERARVEESAQPQFYTSVFSYGRTQRLTRGAESSSRRSRSHAIHLYDRDTRLYKPLRLMLEKGKLLRQIHGRPDLMKRHKGTKNIVVGPTS